jgi:hypothetical protein
MGWLLKPLLAVLLLLLATPAGAQVPDFLHDWRSHTILYGCATFDLPGEETADAQRT